MAYHPIFTTPYVLIFVICWLLLKLFDEAPIFRPNMDQRPFSIARLVVILVGLILCLV